MAVSNDYLRALAAKMDGSMSCHYCGVPTAATIEHVKPRHHGGASHTNNLVLACPYCNTKKSTRDVNEFKESGDWKTKVPDNLPVTTEGMMALKFGWEPNMPYLVSGSSNSRVRIVDTNVLLEVRPGRKYKWEKVNLGKSTNPKVIKACFDFLQRHYTQPKPKYFPKRDRKPWE